jgi:hypothetical protein
MGACAAKYLAHTSPFPHEKGGNCSIARKAGTEPEEMNLDKTAIPDSVPSPNLPSPASLSLTTDKSEFFEVKGHGLQRHPVNILNWRKRTIDVSQILPSTSRSPYRDDCIRLQESWS